LVPVTNPPIFSSDSPSPSDSLDSSSSSSIPPPPPPLIASPSAPSHPQSSVVPSSSLQESFSDTDADSLAKVLKATRDLLEIKVITNLIWNKW
jgi:hypothetical protein